MKPIIIMGASGHARVLINTLLLINRDILGLVDPNIEVGSTVMDQKVLGSDEILSEYSVDDIELVNGIGSIPGVNLRWQLADKMEKAGFRFSQVIHPSALISADVILESGVQIMAGVIIQTGSKIGASSIVNTGAIIDHDCIIEKNCHLAPGVTLSGNVTVGKNTHIGTGTSVIQGITIGEDCVIAAGSVIYKNVPLGTKIIQQR